MNLLEAKHILRENGFTLEQKKQLNEGALTIAAGVALGLIALKTVGSVIGVGLQGLVGLIKKANHKVIMKQLDIDRDAIGEELKEQLMNDAEVAKLIETKEFTKEMIRSYIKESTKKLFQPEYKSKGLKLATTDVHDRDFRLRGFNGGVHNIDDIFDYHEKMDEIINKLTDITYDAIYEIKEEV